MERVTIDDVETRPNPMDVHTIRRPISQALECSSFAMNYFELAPGESFSGGLHTHRDQEEVFYVQEGVATFETRPSIDGADDEVTVAEGEVIRFAPGEFQHGYNDTDEPVVGFAFGAPGARHDWDQIESVSHCQECERERGHGLELTDEGAFRMTCLECDTSFTIG